MRGIVMKWKIKKLAVSANLKYLTKRLPVSIALKTWLNR